MIILILNFVLNSKICKTEDHLLPWYFNSSNFEKFEQSQEIKNKFATIDWILQINKTINQEREYYNGMVYFACFVVTEFCLYAKLTEENIALNFSLPKNADSILDKLDFLNHKYINFNINMYFTQFLKKLIINAKLVFRCLHQLSNNYKNALPEFSIMTENEILAINWCFMLLGYSRASTIFLHVDRFELEEIENKISIKLTFNLGTYIDAEIDIFFVKNVLIYLQKTYLERPRTLENMLEYENPKMFKIWYSQPFFSKKLIDKFESIIINIFKYISFLTIRKIVCPQFDIEFFLLLNQKIIEVKFNQHYIINIQNKDLVLELKNCENFIDGKKNIFILNQYENVFESLDMCNCLYVNLTSFDYNNQLKNCKNSKNLFKITKFNYESLKVIKNIIKVALIIFENLTNKKKLNKILPLIINIEKALTLVKECNDPAQYYAKLLDFDLKFLYKNEIDSLNDEMKEFYQKINIKNIIKYHFFKNINDFKKKAYNLVLSLNLDIKLKLSILNLISDSTNVKIKKINFYAKKYWLIQREKYLNFMSKNFANFEITQTKIFDLNFLFKNNVNIKSTAITKSMSFLNYLKFRNDLENILFINNLTKKMERVLQQEIQNFKILRLEIELYKKQKN
ncbi:hypothetical protein GVAV_001491 [Gurleya vavrai]